MIIYLILINLFTFLLMYLDKQKAIRKEYRIPEKILLSLTFLGGSPAMILAMNKLRHKTIKFRLIVPCIIFIQILLFAIILNF